MRPPLVALLLALPVAAGCGARTGLWYPTPCTWGTGPADGTAPFEVRLSFLVDAGASFELGSAAVDGDRVLLEVVEAPAGGTQQSWTFVAPANLELPEGPVPPTSHALSWPAPGPAQADGSFAVFPSEVAMAHGRQAQISWDPANGCRFVALAADGSPAAAPVTLPAAGFAPCFGLRASAAGFTLFAQADAAAGATAPASLLSLDAGGALLAERALVASATPVAAAYLADGSMLLLSTDGAGAASAQHLTEAGDMIAPPRPFASAPAGTIWSIASIGTSALAAACGPDAAPSCVVTWLSPDGDSRGATTVTKAQPFRLVGSGVSTTAEQYGEEVGFLGWTDPSGNGLVQSISPYGDLGLEIGFPDDGSEPPAIPTFPMVLPTATEALMFFGQGFGGRPIVVGAPLTCHR